MENDTTTIEGLTAEIKELVKRGDALKKGHDKSIKEIGLANIQRTWGSIEKMEEAIPIMGESRRTINGIQELYERMNKDLEQLKLEKEQEISNEKFIRENPEKVCKNCGKLKAYTPPSYEESEMPSRIGRLRI
jgi:uncharacterized protein Yka (UPF0111/DUF47 family)